MKTFRTATLGCKVNQYETREIEELLERGGLACAAEGAAADLVVVNTCIVTAEAARQSRQAVRRLARENPGARLVVTGCYATGPERGDLEAIDGIALVAGDKDDLQRRLAQELGLDADSLPRGISRFAGHTRAWVKIQDGCDQFCTYCIVPHARPKLTSRPAGEVVDEVRRLCASGHREVVLSGIHLGRYGEDLGLPGALPELVERLAGLGQLGRVRLSSIEAPEVTGALLDVMAAHRDRVCPHLHLPLQSGDDGVLRAMGRPYTAAEFLERVARARDLVPHLALTGDVIAGFPGESDAALERTCEVVLRAAFSRLHVFPYSPRAGTPAAEMADQVPAGEKRCRAERLRQLGRELATEFAARLVGRRVTVLVEQVTGNAGGAHAEGFDEHYVRTHVALAAGAAARRGDLLAVRADASDGGTLVGRPAP